MACAFIRLNSGAYFDKTPFLLARSDCKRMLSVSTPNAYQPVTMSSTHWHQNHEQKHDESTTKSHQTQGTGCQMWPHVARVSHPEELLLQTRSLRTRRKQVTMRQHLTASWALMHSVAGTPSRTGRCTAIARSASRSCCCLSPPDRHQFAATGTSGLVVIGRSSRRNTRAVCITSGILSFGFGEISSYFRRAFVVPSPMI